MKKILILIFVISCTLLNNVSVYGYWNSNIDPGISIASITSNDVITKINGYIIPSYSFNGYQVVIAEDLYHYGFNVKWYEDYNSLVIKRDTQTPFTPIDEHKKPSGQKVFDVLSGGATAFVGNRTIPSFDIGGYTAIYIDSLDVFGKVSWDEKSRTVELNLNNEWLYDNYLGLTLLDGAIINDNDYDIKSVTIKNFYYEDGIKIKEQVVPLYDRLYAESSIKFGINDSFYLGTVISDVNYLDGTSKTNNLQFSDIYYLTSDFVIDNYHTFIINSEIDWLNNQIDVQTAQLEKEYKENNYKPVVIYDYWVSKNSIGIPTAYLKLKNVSGKNIDALEVDFKCVDGFNRPVNYYNYGNNTFYGIMQDDVFYYGDMMTISWTLYGYDLTNKIDGVRVTNVHYTDGTSWKY